MDKADLTLEVFTKDTTDHITEGILTCPKCKRYYPIVCGIPVMTPDEYREQQFEAPLLERWQAEQSLPALRDFKLSENE
jgi:uncharacterized protein YbaR (Trm112 family)